MLQSSYGVADVLVSASGDEEDSSLVNEVIEVAVSASEWYVVGQAVLVPGERGDDKTIALLGVDLAVSGRDPGMLALTCVFLINLRWMTLFEGGLKVGSQLFVVVP